MLSRVLGFLRDILFARLFGADGGTDAFFVVFKIPNFLRRLFGEGAFNQAFVPVLADYREHRRAELREFIDRMAGSFAAVLLLVTTLGVAGAPLLILGFAPGFHDDPGRAALAEEMLRITFPYLFFISLTAFAASLLNSAGRFAVPAFTPVLLNLALIGGALWLSPRMEEPLMGLAWAVFVAGVVQLAFQLPFLARAGLLPRPRPGFGHPGVRRTARLMLPALFGSSVAQINLLLDTLIASFLAAGSISWLYYSDRLMEFPLGVFGIALGTVILPSLSRQHAQKSAEEFARTLAWAVRLVWLVGLPATLGLMVLAGPMLATLFQYGAFDAEDTRMAALSLAAYALGLPAFLLVKVLAPGFYARQDTATPVRIGVIAMAANMILNLAIVGPLALAGVPGLHMGLALATALAAWVNAGLLYRGLVRDGICGRRAGPCFGRAAGLAGGLMVAVLLGSAPGLHAWFDWSAWQRAAALAGLIGLGAGTYGVALGVLGLRPRHFLRP